MAQTQTPANPLQAGDFIPDPSTTTRYPGDIALLGAMPFPVLPPDPNLTGVNTFDVVRAWNVPKETGAIAVGVPVYWNPIGNPVTGTSGTGCASIVPTPYVLGFCYIAAASGDSNVAVKLLPNIDADLYGSVVAASSNVTNTTTETSFGQTFTIPANSLRVGDVIRYKIQGIAPTTNSTDTLTIKAYFGSTAVCATAAVDVVNNDIWTIDAEIVIRTIGASGTFVSYASWSLGTPGTATVKTLNTASTTIDTTAAITIDLKATWSVANAGDIAHNDIFDVQLLRR